MGKPKALAELLRQTGPKEFCHPVDDLRIALRFLELAEESLKKLVL